MIDLSFWFDAIRYRWKTVAAVIAIVLIVTIAYIVIAPRTYIASASLLFNERSPAPLEVENTGAPPLSLQTEMDIVYSEAVASKVVENLSLTDDEGLYEAWSESGLDISFEDWLARWVGQFVNVANNDRSRVVTVTASSQDPQQAARFANAYADAAREMLQNMSPNVATGYLDQLRAETTQALEKVRFAENELQSFVSETGIANNGNLGAEADRNASLQVQAAAAQAQAAAARSRSGVAESATEDAERSATIQNIRTQLALKESELNKLASSKGPNHPQIVSAQAEIEMLEQNLERERRATIDAFAAGRSAEDASLQATTNATADRLTSAAATQNARLIEMSENVARMSTLQAELAGAQSHYTQLIGRLERMELEQDVPQTVVQSLDHATVPLIPTSPKVGLLVACAIILGTVVGAAIAIILESAKPVVRSAVGLQRALGVPVIGTISFPKGTTARIADARGAS